ncbi:VTT domain-containing protein [Priestia flexa]|uniref:TVP38/TMEM64 family protein n=1 Tax=Priestia flexa TaxID=86664 RepID=UPI0024C0C734|nr:VTT domain-containing protein [Priestia flexa]WHX77814.1 VTT domain-containing protein [Priestia flexa]
MLFLVAIVLIICITNTDLFNSIRTGDMDKITAFLKENLLITLLFTLVAMLVQNAFTMIPLVLIIAININLLGFELGLIWSWFTSMLAAACIFLMVRYVFQDGLLKKIKPSLLEKIEANGTSYVFQVRVFPFIPTSLINFVAAVSSIRFQQFLWGTASGNLIYFTILSLLSAGLLSDMINEYVIAGVVLLTVALYYIGKFIYKRKRFLAK